MAFGFVLLGMLGVLAALISLGHVEQSSSYGLEGIVSGLLVLAGGFAHWAFGEPRNDQQPPPADQQNGKA